LCDVLHTTALRHSLPTPLPDDLWMYIKPVLGC